MSPWCLSFCFCLTSWPWVEWFHSVICSSSMISCLTTAGSARGPNQSWDKVSKSVRSGLSLSTLMISTTWAFSLFLFVLFAVPGMEPRSLCILGKCALQHSVLSPAPGTWYSNSKFARHWWKHRLRKAGDITSAGESVAMQWLFVTYCHMSHTGGVIVSAFSGGSIVMSLNN